MRRPQINGKLLSEREAFPLNFAPHKAKESKRAATRLPNGVRVSARAAAAVALITSSPHQSSSFRLGMRRPHTITRMHGLDLDSVAHSQSLFSAHFYLRPAAVDFCSKVDVGEASASL